jgi:hypothetical protein
MRLTRFIALPLVMAFNADFRKSPMKMIYRKLPKTASLPVTCHPLRTYVVSVSEWEW